MPDHLEGKFEVALDNRAAGQGADGIKKLGGDTGYEIKIIGDGARIFDGMTDGIIHVIAYQAKHQ